MVTVVFLDQASLVILDSRVLLVIQVIAGYPATVDIQASQDIPG